MERIRQAARIASRAPFEGRFPFRVRAQIEAAQRHRLRTAIEHAFRHVPFYRQTMEELGLRPEDFETAADLAQLPAVDRSHLQEQGDSFRSETISREKCRQLRTSGSTGNPIRFLRDPGFRLEQAIYNQRQGTIIRRLAGRRRPKHLAFLPGRQRDPPADFASRHRLPISPRIVERREHLPLRADVAESIAEINERRPEIISGYGSYMGAIFLRAHLGGERLCAPRVVVYGADAMPAAARRVATEELGAEVLSVYQAVEMPQMAFECEAHSGLHENIDLAPLRIVDRSSSEVPDGESGEILASNLVSRGTVLFNYRIGDLGRREPHACPCGRKLPLISLLDGRADDCFVSAKGEIINPFQVAQAVEVAGIVQYQVIQPDIARLEVNLVQGRGCDEEEVAAATRRNLATLLGAIEVDVRFVDEVPRRTPGAKVRSLISDVSPRLSRPARS